MELFRRIVFDQMLIYLSLNGFDFIHLHTFKKGNSAGTALPRVTDEWLRQIGGKIVVEAVLLDFSTAFDVGKNSVIQIMCIWFS